MLQLSQVEARAMSPKELRSIIRKGWTGITHNTCRDYGQADMVVVPKVYAFDFLLFCNRNPRPCPVLDVIEPGDPHFKRMAPEADLRTDIPKYRVFKNGELVEEPSDIVKYWQDDMVGFLIGCSASWRRSLRAA